ncbi:PREDICTED: MATH domain and coiled-coil domain-containing protein At3g58260-like [Camelina sativa]|uniref:MATH domain and coiled-coil domain-containing protein At3g58260-like n=1 Tax=Camelina sativa TaxID=90675 RepID=A0ABM1QFS1_CAMSA|nr:PREDICTED: MATH domain and coiled-coil domain-containing protein At3g58260-like [Camelina sativa]
MGKQVDNTFTWVIKNVSTMRAHKSSRYKQFVVGGCKWRLIASTEFNDVEDYLYVSLDVPNRESLPSGWRRHAKITLTLVNQLSQKFPRQQETQQWFDQNNPRLSFPPVLDLTVFADKYGGFLVNDGIIIVAAVDVLEVIGSLDEPEKSQSMDVKGFQVLPSQVDVVKTLFEKHPDLAQGFSLKNQHIKNAYMNALLDLIKTLCKASKDLSVKDLKKADDTLSDLIKAGWNLEWLRKKLDQALEKQVEYDTRIRELENQVKKRKLELEELETALEKEKAAASASLMLLD